jgi:hypothetical protein
MITVKVCKNKEIDRDMTRVKKMQRKNVMMRNLKYKNKNNNS